MLKERFTESLLRRLFSNFPVVVVLGARQTGKTTLIKKCFGNNLNAFTFGPVTDHEGARKDPNFFLQTHKHPLFLDEIQYAPELLAAIKQKVDENKKNGMYLLSGSQNLAISKGIAESLAGRAAILHLLPMGYCEWTGSAQNPSFLQEWLNDNSDIYANKWTKSTPPDTLSHIWRGSYPGLLELPDDLIPRYWQSYLETYVERDIRTVADVGSLQIFSSFVALLAAMTSQEINYSELGRELGVNYKTSQSWVSIAESTFQWFSVPSFTRNSVKHLSLKKKGYYCDTGFACYLQHISSPRALAVHPLRGALFETMVVMEIMKRIAVWPTAPGLHHYRTHGGSEIDLLLEIDGSLFPIEIKMKSNPEKNDIKSMRSLREKYFNEKIKKGLIICCTEKPTMLSDDVVAIPWWIV